LRIFGVILAGGESRRMGSDKAFLTLAGRPLILHVHDRLRPQVAQMLVSANRDQDRFALLNYPVIADSQPQGPLSGILAALLRGKHDGATHVVSTPVDTPFVPLDLVERLCQAAETSPQGVALASDPMGDHPATALWPVALAPVLADFLASGEAKVSRFAERLQAARAQFDDPIAFMNLNTPQDLALAQARLEDAG
jgi:molybdopterin-guanine dinucleotide biosynthesis protein A